MRYVSLFSGIEAASVAWEPLGWEPVAFSEIEPFPCELLAKRFPGVPNLGDVSNIDWSEYVGSVDLVVGGSPCQAFSVAGRRRGLVDERGRLMLEYVRAVREIHPSWVLWENVPGVLSQSNGDAFETLQRELADCGYSLAWRTLDAQFFGVAQRRRRVFLVGHLGEDAYPAAVLFERESLRWDSPSSKAKRKELARASRGRAGGGGGAGGAWAVEGNVCDREARQNGSGVSDNVAPTLNTVDRHAVAYGEEGCLNPWMPQHDRVFAPDSVYQTLCAHGSGGSDCGAVLDTLGFAQNSRDEVRVVGDGTVSGALAAEHGMKQTTYVCQPAPVIAFQGNASGSRGFGESEDLAPTLRAGASCGNQAPAIAFKYHQGSKAGSAGVGSDVSPTLTADFHQPAICVERCDMAKCGNPAAPPKPVWRWPWIVRRLMPVECERLQGFPDGWTDLGGTSDTPRYKALGNSMAVPVMRWIGERIAAVEAATGGEG